MRNKNLFTHLLFATTLLCLLSSANAFGQCSFTVTDNQPYIESFDDAESFACWSIEDDTGGTWDLLLGTGSNLASFTHKNDGDMARLVSPVLDLSGVDEASFRYSYAMMGLYNIDELVISYRSSENDTWHDLANHSFSDYANYYEDDFMLPDLSSTYQVSFLGIGHGGIYIFVDNVEIASTTTCARPINLQATEITATSALLSWSTTGLEKSWIMELNGEEQIVDSQPFLLDNLIPQSEYTFKVKADCGEGDESAWSVPFSFSTMCDVILVTDDMPYTDDFESSEEFVCWTSEILSGVDDWVLDLGYVIPNHTAFFIWLGGEARLVSAPLDISTVSEPTLAFKRRQRLSYSGNFDDLSVWYRTSETEAWQQLANFPFATQNWEDVVVSLPNPSSTYQISFLAKANDAEGVYVDDIEIGDVHSVGIVENHGIKASVNPNPTTGKVTIESDGSDGIATVFDRFGRQVASALMVDGRASIDMSGFARGVYMVRITAATGTTTIKLVKE